jgi:hypothetical protein
MTPAERDLTTILLDRLNKIEGQPRDPEAETLIRETTAVRPDAPYSLLQTVLIQDLSLHNAQRPGDRSASARDDGAARLCRRRWLRETPRSRR